MLDTHDSLVEAGKELARVALIAAIPLLIDGIQKGMINWQIVGAAALIAALRAIDKFVHKWDKVDANGLLPF